MFNAVTKQVAVRNCKPVGFQVGFCLNNKTTTMNSTSHTSYLHSKLFPAMFISANLNVFTKNLLHGRKDNTQKLSHTNRNITQFSIRHILPHIH
jgi:hypothetical protein